nr:MAG TPA: hypothetical protein [Caudoviricetes sp.]
MIYYLHYKAKIKPKKDLFTYIYQVKYISFFLQPLKN